jgi:molecular chaperone HtpG
VSLYVRRIFVMAECEELLPPWLRFVRGVVDSQDLPLNVSREMLQNNRTMAQIHQHLVKKVLETLASLLKDRRDDYVRFWEQFGEILKEGIVLDPAHSKAVAEIALFSSSRGEERTTLAEYVERMPKDQSEIFYLSAPDLESAARSPHLEALRAREVEVLYFTDPVDDWVAQHLTRFEEKPLRAIDRGGAQLESEDAKLAREQREREARGLLERLETELKPAVESVRFSGRLKDSPAVLVDDEHALGAHMERILRQTRGDAPKRKRALELNPTHPLIERLAQLYASEPNSPRWKDYADLLHAQALLAEGSPLPDPARFSKLLTEWMLAATPAAPAS